VLLTLVTSAFAQSSRDFTGIWAGKIPTGAFSLRIDFKLTKTPDGGYKATLDSIDQGAKDIPVPGVTVKGDTIHIDMSNIRATYDGTLSTDGKTITGTFVQGANMDVVLTKMDAAPVLKRPQEPQRPYPYDEEEVKVTNTVQGDVLAGTLTKPRTDGPFPAALLITGSGPQNRDEELLGHKPFLILSDYLTRRGIAVLRLDDRGVAKSTGRFNAATTADFATDIEAGVAFLKSRSDIDHSHIGLIGHSEGGIIAPLVASRNKDVAFIVLMAGTGVPGDQVLELQSAVIERAMGAPEARIADSSQGLKSVCHVLRTVSDKKEQDRQILQAIRAALKRTPASEIKKAGGLEKATNLQFASIGSVWMRYFLLYDPAVALRKVHCPVLAINGSKDMQVIPSQNLPAITAALMEAHNPDVTVRELPGLNHLFQTAGTGAPSEYSNIEETIAPIALQTMGDWIVAHVGLKDSH
jgi:pimeloyl-ACP methyl ester carboxylesterase